eukprot:m.80509 g.80509  ORF g.80509 m.80509 type:complete len:449 (+) comp14665_c0_seq6:1040-2386(+)
MAAAVALGAAPPLADGEFVVRAMNHVVWNTPAYYVDLAPIGTGAFGSVCQAVDARTGAAVAIKKLQKPFQDEVHALRAYREIKLLRYMNHENVIGLVNLFQSQVPDNPNPDIYIVQDLMGSDLHTIIQSQYVSEEHVQFLLYQILRALVYVHAAGIIHRDLKPSNIAVNQDCDLKILDFGLARSNQPDGGMTGYVATRWYRAPEIMLNWGEYTEKVDMWSVGCILAELLTNRPLFQGRDHVEQLGAICQLLGNPSEDFISTISSQHSQQYVRQLQPYPPQPFLPFFRQLQPNISNEAVDLLERLIVFDPAKRLSAKEAIRHPFLARFHDPSDEPEPERRFDDSFMEQKLETEQWKALALQETQEFQAWQQQQQAHAVAQQQAMMMQMAQAQQLQVQTQMALSQLQGQLQAGAIDAQQYAQQCAQLAQAQAAAQQQLMAQGMAQGFVPQ